MDAVLKESALPPPGWRLDERGAWVRETVHRMTRRLVGWNYRGPCIYQITVVLADRRSRALGRLRISDGAGGWVDVDEARRLKLAPEAVRAVVEPTALGAAVAACREACAQYYPQVKVIDARVMPDHFHGILWVQRPLVQVQVSRRFFAYRRVPCGSGMKILRDVAGEPAVAASTPEFAARREAFLAAARHGAVLLSPCISDGEREIARLAFVLRLPVIAMRNKGFAPLQKPVGRAFDACADGRLLMLAPVAWPFTPGEKRMTRDDATAMNRLCQWIAGEGAAEIDYHGLRPCDVDSPARIAARVSVAPMR